jgi:hypothetical protein
MYAAPRWGVPGAAVSMAASDSNDSDGLAKFEWDFDGDGTYETDTGLTPFATGQLPNPAGIVQAAVRVTDMLGASAIKAVKLSSEPCDSPFTAVTVETGVSNASPRVEAVNGNPALALGGGVNGYWFDDVRYVRALDSAGSIWPSVQTVSNSISGAGLDLQTVNGKPAIVSGTGSNGTLYWRALDALGDNWDNPPLQVVNDYNSSSVQLLIADGYPAIGRSEFFRRALDTAGDTWAQPTYLQGVDVAGSGFALVAGNPACASHSSAYGTPGFLRALDAGGLLWPASPEPLPPDPESYSLGAFQLTDIGGLPGVAGIGIQRDENYIWTNNRLPSYQGLDSQGSQWNNAVVVENLPPNPSNPYSYPSYKLHTLGGYPALVLHDWHNYRILYYLASATDGSSWNAPEVVDCNGAENIYLDFDTVNGVPVVVYTTAVSTSGNLYDVVKYIPLQ